MINEHDNEYPCYCPGHLIDPSRPNEAYVHPYTQRTSIPSFPDLNISTEYPFKIPIAQRQKISRKEKKKKKIWSIGGHSVHLRGRDEARLNYIWHQGLVRESNPDLCPRIISVGNQPTALKTPWKNLLVL